MTTQTTAPKKFSDLKKEVFESKYRSIFDAKNKKAITRDDSKSREHPYVVYLMEGYDVEISKSKPRKI